MRVKNQEDFWAGVLFIAIGGFFVWFGSEYRIGTAGSMGPGYFPTALGVIVIALGVLVSAISASRTALRVAVSAFNWKVLLLVLGAIILFGVLLKPLGLIPSVVLLVIVSSAASHKFTWRGTVINAIVLASLCFLVFDWALELHITLWPALLVG